MFYISFLIFNRNKRRCIAALSFLGLRLTEDVQVWRLHCPTFRHLDFPSESGGTASLVHTPRGLWASYPIVPLGEKVDERPCSSRFPEIYPHYGRSEISDRGFGETIKFSSGGCNFCGDGEKVDHPAVWASLNALIGEDVKGRGKCGPWTDDL